MLKMFLGMMLHFQVEIDTPRYVVDLVVSGFEHHMLFILFLNESCFQSKPKDGFILNQIPD